MELAHIGIIINFAYAPGLFQNPDLYQGSAATAALPLPGSCYNASAAHIFRLSGTAFGTHSGFSDIIN